MISNNENEDFNLVWITDPHFDHAHPEATKSLARSVLRRNSSAVVITGDIAESGTLHKHLHEFDKLLGGKVPIFFVLGNHDYYGSSIYEFRKTVKKDFTYDKISKELLEPRLGWLASSGVVPLTKKCALVGHDGWYDGQYANWFKSKVILSDYYLIAEMRVLGSVRNLLFEQINRLAKEAADYVEEQVREAVKDFDTVYIATHVPPFRENSVFKGKVSDDDWMPHFSSKTMGDVLKSVAAEYKDKNFVVLCGHSHGRAKKKVASNMVCITGKARYGKPTIADVFTL